VGVWGGEVGGECALKCGRSPPRTKDGGACLPPTVMSANTPAGINFSVM